MAPLKTDSDRRFFERELVALLPWLRTRAMIAARDRQDADDLVQATAERALKYWQQFRPGSNYRAWLYRILMNLFIEGRRRWRESPAEPIELEQLPAPDADPPAAWKNFSLEQVREALPQIAPTLRVVMDAQLRGDTTYRSLAREFGIPPATVATRVFRGREKLRGVLMGRAATNRNGAEGDTSRRQPPPVRLAAGRT